MTATGVVVAVSIPRLGRLDVRLGIHNIDARARSSCAEGCVGSQVTAIRYVMTCVLCARKGDALPSKHPEGWRMVPNTLRPQRPARRSPALRPLRTAILAMRAGQG